MSFLLHFLNIFITYITFIYILYYIYFIYFQKKIGEYIKLEPTATEELIRLFKEQQEAEKLNEENKIQENIS